MDGDRRANWLIVSLTNASPFLPPDTFLQQPPIILFSLVGGVFADRYDRRRIDPVAVRADGDVGRAGAADVFPGGRDLARAGAVVRHWLRAVVRHPANRDSVWWTRIPRCALNSILQRRARPRGRASLGAATSQVGPTSRSDTPASFNSLSFLVVINTDDAAREAHPPGDVRAHGGRAEDRPVAVRHHSSLAALVVLAAVASVPALALLTPCRFRADGVPRRADTYSHLMAFSGAGSIVGALIIAWLGKFPKMDDGADRPGGPRHPDIAACRARAVAGGHLLFYRRGADGAFSTITSLV